MALAIVGVVLWAVWGSLAFLLVIAIVGGYVVVRQALATWRTINGFTAFLGRAGDAITERADEATRKAGGSADAAARLTAAAERLSRSVAYARLIADAAGDASATVTGLRGSVPRK